MHKKIFGSNVYNSPLDHGRYQHMRWFQDGERAMSETSLLRLRAEMARIANEIEGLVDLASIVNVRTHAPALADKIRNAIMKAETKA